jgi:hypothetical protein
LKLHTSALAAVALIAGGLVAAQPAAHASTTQTTAATCSFKLSARLAVSSANTSYPAQLGADCPETMVGAGWTAKWPSGFSLTDQCHGGRCPSISLDMKRMAIGKVTWVGDAWGGLDASGNKVATLLPTATEIRLASSGGLTGGRKGTRTALASTAWYFNPTTNTYVRWAGRKLLLQYQEIGTTTWKGLAYVTTNSAGQVTYNYYPGRTRRYRLYVPASTSVWDFYTPSISR